MKTVIRAGVAMTAMVLAQAALGQSLEEQLRTQLRDARSQVQELQGQQSAWQSQKAGIEGERDQARKALEQAQAELAKLRAAAGDGKAAAAERGARQQAETALQQVRKDNADAVAKLKEQQGRDGAFQTQLDEAKQALGTCSARNQKLYEVGREVIDAYVHMDMASVIGSRQPFAASARVKLENAAQAYGDRLYEQRYVAPAERKP
ncbi:hypothetical protein [Dyella sp. 2RAB6]|uniref:hypothetical protein n=1 Tax=Dyella sp. 2RAB6 TaxID=3232992 RepID=UPI003F8FEB34